MEFLQNGYFAPIYEAVMAYPYLVLFISLLFGGETILLPTLYLGMTGEMRLWNIVVCMILATIVSDTAWYFVGKGLSRGASSIPVPERTKAAVDRLGHAFDRSSLHILFLSKFVYGVRTAAQILCGVRRVPFRKYVTVNMMGVLALISMYTFMMFLIVRVFNLVSYSEYAFQIGFAISMTVIVLLQLWISMRIKKKWHLQS